MPLGNRATWRYLPSHQWERFQSVDAPSRCATLQGVAHATPPTFISPGHRGRRHTRRRRGRPDDPASGSDAPPYGGERGGRSAGPRLPRIGADQQPPVHAQQLATRCRFLPTGAPRMTAGRTASRPTRVSAQAPQPLERTPAAHRRSPNARVSAALPVDRRVGSAPKTGPPASHAGSVGPTGVSQSDGTPWSELLNEPCPQGRRRVAGAAYRRGPDQRAAPRSPS